MLSLLQRCSKSILSLSSPRPQCVCSQQAQLFSSTCSKRMYTHALQCIVLYSTPHPQANLCTNVYRPHQSTAWSPWCMDSQQASLFSTVLNSARIQANQVFTLLTAASVCVQVSKPCTLKRTQVFTLYQVAKYQGIECVQVFLGRPSHRAWGAPRPPPCHRHL